jgi:hypothetical protein
MRCPECSWQVIPEEKVLPEQMTSANSPWCNEKTGTTEERDATMKKMTALSFALILALAFAGSVSAETSGDDPGVATITLGGNSITSEGTGAMVDGTTVIITSAGTYTITGTLNDGQIRVDTQDEETVKLVLNGATIACSTSAPIYVVNAEKTVITLAEGTKNSVTDGTTYVFEDAASDEPDAAIFSNDDLTINGDGSLTVTGRYNHGIASKDDLKMNGGQITVTAVNDGIRGRDSVTVKDGTIIVKAGGDGIQSNNDEDTEKGYISIEGGSITITSGEDGIQAETTLSVSDGTLTITSGSGSAGSTSNPGTGGNPWGGWGPVTDTATNATSDSMKGLKAGVAVTISGGTITIDASDDAIHANDRIAITGGTIKASTGDDGIHADTSIEIGGGDIRIAKSYEGIESGIITINGGDIHIVSSDDGINVVGGNEAPANGGPGQNNFAVSGTSYLHINGGYIAVDATGDGIDVNGPIEMTGGVVIVNGPTGNMNGALDYLGSFRITGGYLIAAGSSGMAQGPSTSSTQYSVMLTLPSVMPAGTMVHIESEGGEEILTFLPTKAYQSVVFSASDLQNGATYVVYTGGSATGTVADGLSSGGTYTPGTKVTSFTISGIVTNAGSAGNKNPGNNPVPDPNANPDTNPRNRPGGTSVPTPFPTQTPSGTGSLAITSAPARAAVFLDNALKGVSPLTLTEISAGTHQLRLTKTGYQDYSTTVTVTKGKTTSVSATLTPASGTSREVPATPTTAPAWSFSGTGTGEVAVSSVPLSANVYLDGTWKGVTPVTLTAVSAGSHELRLARSGYQDYLTSVRVIGGKTTTVLATLATVSERSAQFSRSSDADRSSGSRFSGSASAASLLTGERNSPAVVVYHESG